MTVTSIALLQLNPGVTPSDLKDPLLDALKVMEAASNELAADVLANFPSVSTPQSFHHGSHHTISVLDGQTLNNALAVILNCPCLKKKSLPRSAAVHLEIT